MNRKYLHHACRFSLLAMGTSLYAVAQANVIPDPSFENGQKWNLQDNTMAIVGSPVRTGAKSLKMINVGNGVDSPGHSAEQNSIPGISPGTEYYFDVWVRGNNLDGVGTGGKPLAVVRWRNSSKAIIRDGDGKVKESYIWARYGSYNFEKQTIAVQAPSNANFVDINFRTWYGTTVGESYWDDISLKARDFPGRGTLLGTYQAENANTKSGGAVKTLHTDYSGSGYFDVTADGAVLQWNNVQGGGDRSLAFRYSWEGNVQNLELFVNGVSQGKRKPTATGRRGIWASDVWSANLPSGNNTIRLRINKKGGEKSQPMIDRLEVYATGGGGNPPPPPPAGNNAPQVSLNATQSGSLTRWVSATDGNVTVDAAVTDSDAGDSHSYDWSLTDNMLSPPAGSGASSFMFDPSSVTPGLYVTHVTVTDDGSPNLSSNAEMMLRVVSSLPALSNGTDSDGDGTDDASEGYDDSDNDGIPNFQDAINQADLLQGKSLDANGHLLQAETGLKLKLGQTAFAAGQAAASVTMQNVVSHGGTGGVAAQNADDSGFDYPLGIYDFEVEGLAQAGQSTSIVVPQQGAIPTGAVYRKYINGNWQNFVVDQANNLASAPGQLGTCPPPGDAAYTPGLGVGHFCVQLTIQDGGPNDADGSANAAISDPGGVAITNSSGANPVAGGSSGGGCSFNRDPKNDLVFYLLLILTLLYWVSGRRLGRSN